MIDDLLFAGDVPHGPLGISTLVAEANYGALLVDVWGVIHDGRTVYPGAPIALRRFRENGGAVCLITNAPRPSAVVATQLDRLGFPRAAYDEVVTSGDVVRVLLEKMSSAAVYKIGPDRDLDVYAGLGLAFSDINDAETILCTGLFDDETESPDDYRERLGRCAQRQMLMLCANPDIVVLRAGKRVWCAGALAKLYEELGGKVQYAGKPFRPVYDLAYSKLQALRPNISLSNILAVGDGLETDVRGAVDFGCPIMFVAGGIHGEQLALDGGVDDSQRIAQLLRSYDLKADYWNHSLQW